MKQSLIWQYTTESSTRPSIIVGTIHLGGDVVADKWARLPYYIDQYTDIYTESSLSDEAQTYTSAYIQLPRHVDVFEMITKSRWDKMRATFLHYLGIDISRFERCHPIFLSSLLTTRLMGISHDLALDHKIWSFATAHHKSPRGIESTEEQIQTLLSIDLRYQYQQLIRFSKNVSKARRSVKTLLSAYQAEDLQALNRLSRQSLGPDRRHLLIDRNIRIADRIADYHSADASFFSFGAGHLYGATGVLKLLKEKGGSLKALLKPV